ncbi:MAG: hypothetical protein Q8942_06285 [Bacillota bacterium]|nr:hypothetical protein [Bacillota bacterium]
MKLVVEAVKNTADLAYRCTKDSEELVKVIDSIPRREEDAEFKSKEVGNNVKK